MTTNNIISTTATAFKIQEFFFFFFPFICVQNFMISQFLLNIGIDSMIEHWIISYVDSQIT